MELWDHQRKAIERAKQVANLAIFADVGTGKSRTLIEIIRWHCNTERRIVPTLILGPLIVCAQWKREFAKFSKVPESQIVVLDQAGAKRLKQFSMAKERHHGNFVAVTNYEALLTEGFREALQAWDPSVLVLDESHRCKDPSSRRVKYLKPIADKAAHTYLLTGTPVLNTPMDLFAQYLLMDGGETFGRNFFKFRLEYFYDANAARKGSRTYFPDWRIQPNAIERFQAKMAATAVQARKSECLDLPPLVEIDLEIDMGPEQRRAYEEMKRHYVTQVQNQLITAQLAITQALRLRQILAGFIQDGDGPAQFFEDNPRLAATLEKVESLVEQGQKVIIWTEFKPTYALLERELVRRGITPTFLTGEQSATEKDANVQAFCKGDVPVLISNARAGGTGVNLIEASASVYYSRSYSLGDLEQSRARNYRGGSEMHTKVTHYNFITKGTLDEVIKETLASKGDVAQALLRWAKEQG
jgi:SNF2 family DNA or RNA helicase